MATGGGSRSEGASFDSSRSRRLGRRFSPREPIPLTECFERRRKIEGERTQSRCVQTLERDILRILTDNRHSDFYIIYDRSVIETSVCILKARSPRLYEILESQSVRGYDAIRCYIENPQIFQRIKHFSRLVYSNLDIRREERVLVRHLSTFGLKQGITLAKEGLHADSTFYCIEEGTREDIARSSFKREDAADELNAASTSDMADSGLETGSLSPLENTDTSVTDLEVESHELGTDRASVDDDFVSVGSNGEIEKQRYVVSLTSDARPTTNSSFTSNDINVSSDSRSNRKIRRTDTGYPRGNSTIPSESLEFVDSMPTTRVDVIKNGYEKSSRPFLESSRSNDPSRHENCSGVSGYYFIDASNLNDDGDGGDDDDDDDDDDDNDGDQANEEKRENDHGEERKDGHESIGTNISEGEGKIARSKRESRTRSESAGGKRRGDSTSEKDSVAASKSVEKEALVVEIKEADSGESTQPSPCGCSDNNATVGETSNVNRETRLQEETDPHRASLIRRNTFELDSNDDKLSILRQEYERRQGHLIFQGSIPQYSGHRVDGDSCFEPSNDQRRSSLVPRVAANYSMVDGLPRVGLAYSTGTAIYNEAGERGRVPTINNASVSRSGSSWLPVRDPENSAVSEDRAGATRLNDRFLGSHESPEGTIPSSRSSEHDFNGRVGDEDDDDEDRDNGNDRRHRGELDGPISRSSAEDGSLVESRSESDDGSRNCCKSLPITLNDSRVRLSQSQARVTRTRCDNESTPILSGGVSSSDFSRQNSESSATAKKRFESIPIVSGGSVLTDDFSTSWDIGGVAARATRGTAAWVVDMSDCGKNPSAETSSEPRIAAPANASLSNDRISSNGKNSKDGKEWRGGTEHAGGLGFFVDLGESREKRDERKRATAENEKRSCEFFVDVSNENGGINEADSRNSVESSDGRKNIFSMFIDLREPSGEKSDDELSRSSRASADKSGEPRHRGKTLSQQPSGESLGLDAARPSSGVFMFIESDSPVVRRRALSSSRPAFQRHSWNVADKTTRLKKDCPMRREHKRAHSVSIDRTDLRKLQTESSNSSHSLSQVARADTLGGNSRGNSNNNNLFKRINDRESSDRNTDTSAEEVFEFDVRDTPPNSHVEIVVDEKEEEIVGEVVGESTDRRDEEPPGVGEKIYEDECSDVSAWEKTGTESTTEGNARKNETYDVSTGASGASPESDSHDSRPEDRGVADDKTNRNEIILRHLQQCEDLIIDDIAAIAAIGSVSENRESLPETAKKIESEVKKTECRAKSLDVIAADIESKNKDGASNAKTSGRSSFVRLSDLDETRSRSRASDLLMSKDCNSAALRRMSNSIPETSWVESKLAFNRNDLPIRALPRKFTTLMSTSLPAKHKSPIQDAAECEGEAIVSESDLSSMQSSMGRSGADVSTEETETSSMGVSKPYNRLGEDLLRMFLEEINPDVTIDVGGRQIRAHKCILSSRCQYFAAILSGGWVESAGNLITLQGYSYGAVHFALCHIYSGESNIPETLSIVELATLADMLCLEGLKEVIGYTLKVKYCHLFHKPCQACVVGVVECMPLAAAYGLDELYRKSLRWITRHFVRVWPCKAFASLPRELVDKCYHQHIVHMSTDNVLQTMMDCDKLLATLPNVRWAEPVFRMVSNLLETAVKYTSENFSGVLGNDNFHALGRDLTWNISRLEDNFLAAADRLPPDQACKSYAKLSKMLSACAPLSGLQQQSQRQSHSQQGKPPWSPLFVDFLLKIQTRVEKCLVKEASRAARTTTWLKMDLELRRRIQELACLVILPHEAIKRPSRRSNFLKEPRAASSSSATRTSTAGRSSDLRRVRVAVSEDNEVSNKRVTTSLTSASAVTLTQAKKPLTLVKPKSDPLERKNPQEERRGLATTSLSHDSVALRPKSWPNKLEVKSRYLEPRNKPVTKENTQQAHRERLVVVQQRRKIMISSSDSSRTSSPAMKRAIDEKPMAKMKLTTIKRDVRALSSDSLAEATCSGRSTNRREASASKSCGITRPESPSLGQNDGEPIGLSADSLAESHKRKPQLQQQQQQQQSTVTRKKKVTGKMDTSMSTDSLMAEITITPKSSSKVSPELGRTTPGITTRTQIYDRTKKSSPPTQRSNASTACGARAPRSVESSTAASRNRAAAISAYHGSPNLRRNLLEAAKTPDVPVTKAPVNGLVERWSSPNPVASQSTVGNARKERVMSNQSSTESPSKRFSPKSNGSARRTVRVANTPAKRPAPVRTGTGGADERTKTKCNNAAGTEAAKQPTVGSRSGTFLKDEPTVLKKSDAKTAARVGGS